ncbi:hypothetical protein KSP40_PGU020314 [Platanthera guangdongensis]|uniref:Uncharacterized protein n=1 Tax=Platanthera guangdongensis TaxID=2320717 RepID=A0ABR2M983_9ASPA
MICRGNTDAPRFRRIAGLSPESVGSSSSHPPMCGFSESGLPQKRMSPPIPRRSTHPGGNRAVREAKPRLAVWIVRPQSPLRRRVLWFACKLMVSADIRGLSPSLLWSVRAINNGSKSETGRTTRNRRRHAFLWQTGLGKPHIGGWLEEDPTDSGLKPAIRRKRGRQYFRGRSWRRNEIESGGKGQIWWRSAEMEDQRPTRDRSGEKLSDTCTGAGSCSSSDARAGGVERCKYKLSKRREVANVVLDSLSGSQPRTLLNFWVCLKERGFKKEKTHWSSPLAESAITRGIFNASRDHASPFDGSGHGTIAVYKALYKTFGGFAADVVAAIDQVNNHSNVGTQSLEFNFCA